MTHGPVDRLTSRLADRYRIERELGAGGMATVYLAFDVRHARNVALKVLKPELAAVIGAARFLAEIKTTANLQHPHILSLHDSGEIDGTVYYVMPFVDGESLRDRLTREKQLPIGDAVRIATQVADALQYAHAHGVIHRDVKPENILLHDGHAVVADFGIALAARSADSRMTETGMSLGTPHYMSPEQAMGERDLDARTDVYALGCVLYEMLTGQPPFTGPTAQSIVAKVITERAAPPSALRGSVNAQLDDAVLTALEKLPADRFESAAKFSSAIAEGAAAPRATRVQRASDVRPRARRAVAVGLALIAIALLAAAGWVRARGGTVVSGPTVYDAALPDSAPMSFTGPVDQPGYGTATTNVSISADGAFAVYPVVLGESSVLWSRSLRDARGGPIAGTEGGVSAQISPDGSRVAFVLANKVMVVPVTGGTPKQLTVVGTPVTLQWLSPRQLIALHSDGQRLAWIDAEAGLTRETRVARCTFGKWISESGELLCGMNRLGWMVDTVQGTQRFLVGRAADGSPGNLARGSDFRLVGEKYVVFVSPSGDLSAASYDAKSQALGRSVVLVPNVRRESAGLAQYDISANGTLVYVPGPDAQVLRMVTIRSGQAAQPLPLGPDVFQRFDLSRDRRKLAAVVLGAQGQELRIYDLKDGQSFTWLRARTIRHALWNRDGTRLLVSLRDSARSYLVSGSPASANLPDTIASAPISTPLPELIDFSDEHTALVQIASTSRAMRIDPSVHPLHFDTLALEPSFMSLSPSGRLVTYQDRDGRIMLGTFPLKPERIQLAAQGVEPLWLSDTEVLFRSGVSWYSSRVNPATGEPAGSPTLWARDPRFSDTAGWSNRVSWDGGIIYAQGPEQSSARYLRVVPNWVAQMKAAVDSVGN
ncbi:MAG TPA: serine/threonine-protein kinase [Gemmatimonadaceae bacterium]|nr:serine/threonine-protein kinase [Gemmatimonadaceae bacterium]